MLPPILITNHPPMNFGPKFVGGQLAISIGGNKTVTCHTTNAVLEFLPAKFRDCDISRYSDIPWPAISPDLNPLDYFLWGNVMAEVRQR